jgi:6-phosphogluconolactonase
VSEPMRVDVYPSAGEAFAATAELAAARLRDAPAERALAVALSGGRDGRGVLAALAGRDDLPWARIEWFWGDERCVEAGDRESNVRLAREALLAPRRIPEARVHPPPAAAGEPDPLAAAYAETLRRHLPGSPPVFDLVLLGLGRDGHVAALMPGSRALEAEAAVAPVALVEVSEEPRVARITITPSVLRAAGHVILTVTGEDRAAAVAAAMADPFEPARVPAQLVRPSPRVSWVMDRAAAADLLRGAAEVPQ